MSSAITKARKTSLRIIEQRITEIRDAGNNPSLALEREANRLRDLIREDESASAEDNEAAGELHRVQGMLFSLLKKITLIYSPSRGAYLCPFCLQEVQVAENIYLPSFHKPDCVYMLARQYRDEQQ